MIEKKVFSIMTNGPTNKVSCMLNALKDGRTNKVIYRVASLQIMLFVL